MGSRLVYLGAYGIELLSQTASETGLVTMVASSLETM